LKTPQWANVRDLVLDQLVDGKCSRCHNFRATVVHHTHYKTLGRENPYDGTLVALCRDCHQFIHGHSGVDPRLCKTEIDLMQAKLKEI
jgi:5-methylcytosine-specific restriction endonuclease McrA